MANLLVSVRSVAEACTAIAGGAEIIDVKEPKRGSLGMADADVIAGIARSLSMDSESARPVSAALGEANEWLTGSEIPVGPDGLTYCKLGLAGLTAVGDWREAWIHARGQVERQWNRGVDVRPRWIAVAYVDWQRAGAPEPRDVVRTAGDTNCAGVLFDTSHKDGRGLLDWLDPSQLSALIETIHAADMLAAVAGGLRCEDVQRLIGVKADVFAIRTAACEQGRNSAVSESAVRRFREAMAAAETRAAGESPHRPAG